MNGWIMIYFADTYHNALITEAKVTAGDEARTTGAITEVDRKGSADFIAAGTGLSKLRIRPTESHQ